MAQPFQIAHRGGAGLWPENTLEAFERALKAGADGIELDVHLTRDRVLVVHHDERLNPAIARGLDGQWVEAPAPLIKNLTFVELQAYDIGRLKPGSAYAAKFPLQQPFDGSRIPRLEDVFLMVKQSGNTSFRLYVEAKTSLLDLSVSAQPEELAEAIVALVRKHSLEAQTILVSFDWRALVHAKKIAPDIQNAFTTLPFADIDPENISAQHDVPGSEAEHIRAASAAGAAWMAGFDWRFAEGSSFAEKMLNAIGAAPADGWFAWYGDITPEMVTMARSHRLAVSAWTADEPHEVQRLRTLQLEAILTDRPDLLSQILSS